MFPSAAADPACLAATASVQAHAVPGPGPARLAAAGPFHLLMPAGLWRSLRLAALGSLLAVGQQAQAVSDEQFAPAFARFNQAIQGQSQAVEPAVQAFARLLQTEPTNPVLLAYSGAATSLQATTTWLPWKKLGYAEDGLARIDKALALLTPAHNASVQRGTPGVLDVKLVAANTFLAVPGFMNRHDRGERLLKEVLASPLLASAPAEFRAAVDSAAAKAGLAKGAK